MEGQIETGGRTLLGPATSPRSDYSDYVVSFDLSDDDF